MSKRPIKPTSRKSQQNFTADSANDSISQKAINVLDESKRIMHTDRFQVICGLVLVAVVIYLMIAYISFAIHGNADSSILAEDHAFRAANRTDIMNVTGICGASIVFLLIDKAFGWASIALVFFLTICSLRLLKATNSSLWRALFIMVFAWIWGSILLATVVPESAKIGYRFGGAHGQFMSDWLSSYIHPFGLWIVLLLTLAVFLISIDRNTIPRAKRCWAWIVNKFKALRHRDDDIEDDEDLDDDADNSTEINIENSSETDAEQTLTDDASIVIDLQPEASDNDQQKQNSDDPEIEILVPNEEQEPLSQPAEQSVDENPAQAKPEAADIPIEIAEVKATEMAENDPEYLLKKLGPYDPRLDLHKFQFPSLDLLKTYPKENEPQIDMEEQKLNQDRIISTFRSFNIDIIKIKATIGPTVTLYEIVPKEGTRISRIQTLEKDIMMSLSADGIRMIAPMPGKGTVGIEVPNKKPQIVSMHSVVASRKFQEEQKMRLPVVMGKTITNEVFTFDLAKAPHLLVAGATGQGKSVGLNAIITSLLYKKHPAELKFVLVDPKMVEFTIYKDLLKHYMAAMPDQEDNEIIITDCQKVINTLNSLVIEMENRYKLLMEAEVRNLEDYNEKFIQRRLNPEKGHRYLPYIVIIIDEFGDFIMQAGKQVETPIARITQKARAVGMHMILATQRPSVNIITGVIKANIPTRIAFRCQSIVDSRTVLDTKGAEGLCGKGDMLYSAGNGATRLQCAFVDTPEVIDVVKHIAAEPSYPAPYMLPEYVPDSGGEDDVLAPGAVDLRKLDALFTDVARFVVANQQGSTSVLQRKFQIGYNRAGKLTDQLEAAGIVGPNQGAKGRQVLVQDDIQLTRILEDLGL